MPGSEAEGARLLDAYLAPSERGRGPLVRLVRCLLAHQLAHEWRTMAGNRSRMPLSVNPTGMYFI